MENKTKFYRGIHHGDWVRCMDCGALMLLPHGADACPECTGEHLAWASDKEEEKEMTLDKLAPREQLEYVNRELQPQDYLQPETLQQEMPELYRELIEGYMGCTDVYDICHYLKRMMVDEMKKAIKAHGTEYVFSDVREDDEDIPVNMDACPIVACNPDDYDPEPRDVYIIKLYIDEYDDVCVKALGKETMCEVKMEVMDIFLEHMGYLISEMLGTAKVQTVSEDKLITINIKHNKPEIHTYYEKE